MNLTIQPSADGVLAGLSGDLAGAEAAAFADEFKAKVPEGSVATLDFSGVRTVDIEGLRKLITVDRWLKGRGGRLVLAGVSDEVSSLLKSNGVEGMFEIVRGAPPAAAPPPAADPPPAPEPAPVAPPPVAPPPREVPRERERIAPPSSRDPLPPAPAEPPPPRRRAAAAETPPPRRSEEPPAPVADEGAWSAPAPAAASPPAAPSRTPSPGRVAELADDPDVWSADGGSKPAKPAATSGNGGGGSAWLIPGLALVLALAGGAVWWFGFRRSDPPEILSGQPQVALEVGTLAEFKVNARFADAIVADGPEIPGLKFQSSAFEGDVTGSYSGNVSPEAAGRSVTVTFTATRGEAVSTPYPVTFTVRTPMQFEQTEFLTEAGKPFAGRVVTGATACRIGQKPYWMALDKDATTGRTFWNLTGTPPEAGIHKLQVFATDEAGQEQSGSITVTVTAPVVVVQTPPVVDPPPVDDTPPVDPPPVDDTPPVDPPPVVRESPPPPKGEVPDKLRRMIRSRMDAMSTARLSPEMRIRINNGLDQMEDAAVVASVVFASNSSTLDSRAEGQLERRLADPKIRALLDSERRQIIVIGYASPKGSADHNLGLSRARADTVARFLNTRGFRPRFSDGYGETKVVGSDAGSNQAVEVYVVVPAEGYVDPLEQLASQLEQLRSLMKAEEAR